MLIVITFLASERKYPPDVIRCNTLEVYYINFTSSYILFLFEKLIPDVAQIFNKLRATHKKSKIELADLEVILEILESSGKKTLHG
jgi:hypothetical protein